MNIRDFILITFGFFTLSFNSYATNAPISTLGTVTACPGSVVNVPITVTNFTLIGSLNLRIDYDPQVMTYNGFTANAAIPGAFVAAWPIPNSNLYQLVINWASYPGITLSGTQTLFTLKFNYINGNGTLVFNDSLGDCEYAKWVSIEPEVLNDSPTSSYYINGSVVGTAIVTPAFAALGPYCVGAAPGALPGTSTNGITGTWSPAAISTASAGTITYTFTPTAGQCATTTTMNVVVNAKVTPTFAALGPYCVGATPGALVLTSINNIPGTWSPSAISTVSAGTITYTFTPTAGQCATTTTMDVSSIAVSSAGTITGSQSVAPNTIGHVYTTPIIPNATSYTWTVPTGFTITSGSGTNSITVSATNSAVSGTVTVMGTNTCGDGPVASLSVEVLKTLSVNVWLESLYNGLGMNKAKDAIGDKYSGTIADQITVELHNPTNYATIVYSVNNVNLSTAGAATLTLPLTYSGSYYLTIRHRNSIETTSASPVSFSGGSISYSFDLPAKAFGNNLKLLGNGVYGIFAADVNQDGVVDATDLVAVDNAAATFSSGYVNTDVNGTGQVDASDITMTEANSAIFVTVKKP